jgi:hypothetical protein
VKKMLKIGDKVKYHDLHGEVTSVMDDMILVKGQDGKEYSLPHHSVTVESPAVTGDFSGIIAALKPHLKDINFLNGLARTMSENGINELHIRGGAIHQFSAKESLAERVTRYKKEALETAEKKAQEDHAKENGLQIG